MRIDTRRAGSSRRRGGVLVMALFIVVALAGIAATVFATSMVRNAESMEVTRGVRAFYLAETAVTEALMTVALNERDNVAVPKTIGQATSPVHMQKGSYWCELSPDADGNYTVVATGTAGSTSRTIEAIIGPVGTSAFDHAIMAGNISGDPTYTLKLSGSGSEADSVTGNIYSGNHVDLQADASVTGEVAAQGSIKGTTGVTGISRPILDVDRMNYEVNHDVDVAGIFSSSETWSSNSLGGSAYQVAEDSPAHIFRKNPDDRTSETSSTTKDDYFLEDPYETVTDFKVSYSGNQGHTVTLSGVDGEVGPTGTGLVYYVDGNLWVHNKRWLTMRFNKGTSDTLITFVVKGNVYFSDDVTLTDEVNDGVAFIAIEDEKVADSGNVYLGDPRYGTVERLYTFLYAENDFIDYNLDEYGSKSVSLYGNMTAGDHVAIERDFVKSGGTIVHSKLTVNFDDRISKGTITLPGIPTAISSLEGFSVLAWREVQPH